MSGGFDEDFFAHMEEIDLCWRLNREGYKIYYQGKSKVFHVGGGTLSASNPKKTHLNFRNGLSLIVKNLPSRELLWKLPIRLTLDWFAALLFLANNKAADAKAVLTAHVAFFKNLRLDILKRDNGTKASGIGNNSAIKLLPLQYFIFRRRKFTELK
jgi:GT2 family glycosyltransferase